MYSNFTEEARKTLILAKQEMNALKHPYVGSEHLLLALLKQNKEVAQKLKEHGITYDLCKDKLVNLIGLGKEENKSFIYTTLVKRILESACLDSRDNNHGEVTDEHLMIALLEEGEGVAIRILIELQVDMEALYQSFTFPLQARKKRRKNKLVLEELGVDLNKKALDGKLDMAVGREIEIKQIIEILSRRKKNNPVLIGEAGVGKTAIVEELARRIVKNQVPSFLKNKRIISLDMASAVSGTKYRGEFEERINKILKEIEENQDIILFIDEIHTLVGAGGAEGAIDASNILKPALARGTLHCIGATTNQEYKKFIEKDSALERRFQKVEIVEPNDLETLNILKEIKTLYEDYHQVNISYEILKQIVSLSNRYFQDRHQPDKAIDILDEVCACVHLKESKMEKKLGQLEQDYQALLEQKNQQLKLHNFKQASYYKKLENEVLSDLNNLNLTLSHPHKKNVTKEDIYDVVVRKTKIPIHEISGDTKQTLLCLQKKLTENVIGQKEVITKLLQVAKRIKCGYQKEKCQSFLFVGPSGVGKTLLAKTYAEAFYKENVIKLDMSEYSEAHSISKILGAPPGYVGYEDHHGLLDKIRLHPYTILILDELEKAHPRIIYLLYQILEDGYLKDASGKEVSFKHTMLIMTSNVGFSKQEVGFLENENQKINRDLKQYFSIPFLNRLDYIIPFNYLNEESMKKIIKKKINNIEKEYHVTIKRKIISEILNQSNYLEYGARQIDKIVQNGILDQILDNILQGKNETVIETLNKVTT